MLQQSDRVDSDDESDDDSDRDSDDLSDRDSGEDSGDAAACDGAVGNDAAGMLAREQALRFVGALLP